jgi:hypothetical protein
MLETVCLSNPESSVRIEYSRAAMEQIRERARVGLMAAPRVVMGVGGLLIGAREHGRILLLSSIEFPCSHSTGPSFSLTADEKAKSGKMIAEAGEPGMFGQAGVIGWYCSKPRGDTVLNEADLEFHGELFPDPRQIALVVRPSILEPMHAAFFIRDRNGALIKAVECVVDEWRPAVTAELKAIEAEMENLVVSAPAPVETVMPVETTQPDFVPATPPDKEPAASEIPVGQHASAATSPELFGVSGPAPPHAPRRSAKLAWILGGAAAIAAGGAAFLTQDLWKPKPPLTLNSTELNGDLLIRWNADALRGIDHASMFVNDGGQLHTLPLDRFALNSGLLSYTPKSRRVTAKLNAGETTGITVWFAPEPAPTPPSASDPPPRAAPSRPKPRPVPNKGKPPARKTKPG